MRLPLSLPSHSVLLCPTPVQRASMCLSLQLTALHVAGGEQHKTDDENLLAAAV